MKLNNHGWGLAMMIVLMSILLAFLLLVTILIYNFYENGYYEITDPIQSNVINLR